MQIFLAIVGAVACFFLMLAILNTILDAMCFFKNLQASVDEVLTRIEEHLNNSKP